MSKNIWRTFLGFHRAGLFALMAGLHLPATADTLYVGKTAEYRNPVGVQQVIRDECQIDTRLPVMIQEQVGKLAQFSEVSLADDPLSLSPEFAIVASIISLEVPPGAGWSTGTKFMKVKAILYRHGENVGEFVHSERMGRSNDPIRNATKYRGNCKIAEHLADNVSERLAVWLKKKNIQANQRKSSSASN